jgi:Mce-associated membrane protein
MTDEDTSTTDPTAVRRRPREVVLGAGVVALLIVALAVALVMTSIRLHDDDKNASRLRQAEAVDAARVSSLAAARTYAVDLTSYNYKTLTAGFAAVASHSSPSFRASFEKSSAALVPVLKKYDAVSKGTVVAAGLASCTTAKAEAVILLDQTVTNTADKKGPTTDESRVAMTLVVDHGHWVIDQVKLLS